MLSRITGFVRELVWAALVGPSRLSDIFIFCYTIPNLLRRFFGEGTFASAFVPVLSELEREKGVEAARRFASRVLGVQGLITGAFTVLAGGGAFAAALLSPPGSDARLYGAYLGVMAPYAVFICAAALLGAALNTRGVFFLPPAVQVIMNITWIGFTFVAAWVTGIRWGLFVLGGALVAACAFGAWLLWKKAAAEGFRITPVFRGPAEGLGKFFSKYFLTIFGVAAFQLNVFMDRVMAQFLVAEDGALTVLYQGERMMQYPIGVLAVAIGTAALAKMSAWAHRRDRFALYYHRAMGLSFFLSLLAAGVFGLLSTEAVDLALNWGAFRHAASMDALARASRVLAFYAAGYPAYFALNVLTKAFYSMQDMRTPVQVGGWMVVANFALNLLFLRFTPLAEGGLALSSALCAWVNAGMLLWVLSRRRPDIRPLAGFAAALRPLAAALPAAAALLAVRALLGGGPGGEIWRRAAAFALPALAFAVVYAGIARAFGVRDAVALIPARFFRFGKMRH